VQSATTAFETAREARQSSETAAREARKALPDLERADRAAQAAMAQYETDIARASAQKTGLEDRIARLSAEAAELDKQVKTAETNLADHSGGEDLSGQRDALAEQLREARDVADEASAQYRSLKNESEARAARLKAVEAERANWSRRSRRQLMDQTNSSNAEQNSSRTSLRPKRVDLLLRMFSAKPSNCEPSELKSHLGELSAESGLSENDIERKLERLNKEREKMGGVNLRADEEAVEQEERLAAMIAEREDLVAAIARLREGIDELNTEGRQRLLAAFDKVNTHFGRLFTTLFGGGEAALALTESDDPLQAGLIHRHYP